MEQAEPDLKVTDRRHFTADGQLKTDAPAPSPGDAAAASVPPSAESSPDPRGESPDGQRGGHHDPPPVTFSSFIISLATQAADYIGGEERDLGAARQMISALEMLKDKSEGRRTDDETRIIEAILFDLRMAFVDSAKGGKP